MPGGIVASTAHRDLESMRLAEGQRHGHILGVHAAGDRRRPPVDQEVEAEARSLVLAIGRCQNVAGQRVAELGEALGHA